MIIVGCILAFICVTAILAVCGYAFWKLKNWKPTVIVNNSEESNKAVSTLVQMLEEEKAEKEREVRDSMLAQYAESKRKQNPLSPQMSGQDDGILKTHNPAGKNILIPMKMSKDDREVLKAFYDL